jgi:hypothetical protein
MILGTAGIAVGAMRIVMNALMRRKRNESRC